MSAGEIFALIGREVPRSDGVRAPGPGPQSRPSGPAGSEGDFLSLFLGALGRTDEGEAWRTADPSADGPLSAGDAEVGGSAEESMPGGENSVPRSLAGGKGGRTSPKPSFSGDRDDPAAPDPERSVRSVSPGPGPIPDVDVGAEVRASPGPKPSGAVEDGVSLFPGVTGPMEGVHPELKERVERVGRRMWDEFGHRVEVVEGRRSQERQNLLYAQGRSAPGPVVTWTRNSAHLRGNAVDVMIDGGWDNAEAFQRLQAVAREEGLRTLGTRDPGHLELPSRGLGSRSSEEGHGGNGSEDRVLAEPGLRPPPREGRGSVGAIREGMPIPEFVHRGSGAGTAPAAPVRAPLAPPAVSVASPAPVARPAEPALPLPMARPLERLRPVTAVERGIGPAPLDGSHTATETSPEGGARDTLDPDVRTPARGTSRDRSRRDHVRWGGEPPGGSAVWEGGHGRRRAVPTGGPEGAATGQPGAPTVPGAVVAHGTTAPDPATQLMRAEQIRALQEAAPPGARLRVDLSNVDGSGTDVRLDAGLRGVSADFRSPDPWRVRDLRLRLGELRSALLERGMETERLTARLGPAVPEAGPVRDALRGDGSLPASDQRGGERGRDEDHGGKAGSRRDPQAHDEHGHDSRRRRHDQ